MFLLLSLLLLLLLLLLYIYIFTFGFNDTFNTCVFRESGVPGWYMNDYEWLAHPQGKCVYNAFPEFSGCSAKSWDLNTLQANTSKIPNKTPLREAAGFCNVLQQPILGHFLWHFLWHFLVIFLGQFFGRFLGHIFCWIFFGTLFLEEGFGTLFWKIFWDTFFWKMFLGHCFG